MNLNLYLPDDLGRQAKDADLPLSRLLRDAVTEELERRQAVQQTLEETSVHEVEIEEPDGDTFTGRITGKVIAEEYPLTAYLTDDERVLVYHEERLKYWTVRDPETELRDAFRPSVYQEAMGSLGIKAVIDL